MKSLIKGILILFFVSALGVWFKPGLREAIGLTIDDAGLIQRAYEDRISNILVETDAKVRLVLPDLDDREEVQLFMVELENGHQLRVKHNIEVASSVPLKPGSEIRLRGEYDWSPDGGVIHWTHADPQGERDGGWIEHAGRRYF